jgi:hypothetical protein
MEPTAVPGEAKEPEGEGDVRGESAGSGPARFFGARPDRLGGGIPAVLLSLLAVLGALLTALLLAGRTRTSRERVAAGGALGRPDRPVLLLEVNGVVALSPFHRTMPPGRLHMISFGPVYLPDRVPRLLRELTGSFELVWITEWEHHAHIELRSLLGMREDLPVLAVGAKRTRARSDWATKLADRYAGDRPVAWIGEHSHPSRTRWAERRRRPTLLISVHPALGLTEDHVEQLLRWAAVHAPAPQPPRSNVSIGTN